MLSRSRLAAVFLIIVISATLAVWPRYEQRRIREKANRVIALAFDYEDLQAQSKMDPTQLSRIIDDLKHLPLTFLALSEEATAEDEERVRQSGCAVLWQVKTSDYLRLRATLERFQSGDALMSVEKHAAGYPMFVQMVAETLRTRAGLLPVVEFMPQVGFASLAMRSGNSLIKAHVLGDREVFSPQPSLWRNRILRAARERGVRFFYLRLPPSYSWEEKLAFLTEMTGDLKSRGFHVGRPESYAPWPHDATAAIRMKIAVFLAVITPLVGFWIFGLSKPLSPYFHFVGFSVMSVAGGVAANLIGANSSVVLGITALSGVKAQLIIPLIVGAFLLLPLGGINKLLDMNLKLKHLVFMGGVIGVLGAMYLMRSGNFPLIPVSGAERHVRDVLEEWLGTRPRFKEFFIGHPALITAFYAQKIGLNARWLLLIGLIGQISIVNTFLHFHIPLELCLLRTLHGLWIGSLISLPFCWAAHRFVKE